MASADANDDVIRDSNYRIRRQGLLGSIAEGVAEGLVEGLIIGNQYPSYYGIKKNSIIKIRQILIFLNA